MREAWWQHGDLLRRPVKLAIKEWFLPRTYRVVSLLKSSLTNQVFLNMFSGAKFCPFWLKARLSLVGVLIQGMIREALFENQSCVPLLARKSADKRTVDSAKDRFTVKSKFGAWICKRKNQRTHPPVLSLKRISC